MTTTPLDSDADSQLPRNGPPWRGRSRLDDDHKPAQTLHLAAGARQPFWWALLATVVLSTAGGLAIYVIHSTTPETGHGQHGGIRDTGKGRPVSSTARPPAQAANPSVTAQTLAPTPLATPSQPVAAVDASRVPSAPTMSLPPATPASELSIQWSRDQTPTTVAGTAASGRVERSTQTGGSESALPQPGVRSSSPPSATDASHSRQAPEGTGSFPPIAAGSARPVAATNTPPPAPTASTAPSLQAKATPAARPEPVNPSSRLKDVQDRQCAETNFFNRLICDERVRLRHCRDRWNEHPDCMVAAQRDP